MFEDKDILKVNPKLEFSAKTNREVSYADLFETYLQENQIQLEEPQEPSQGCFLNYLMSKFEKLGARAFKTNQRDSHKRAPAKSLDPQASDESFDESDNSYSDINDFIESDLDEQHEGDENDYYLALSEGFFVLDPNSPNDSKLTKANLNNELISYLNQLMAVYENGSNCAFPKGANELLLRIGLVLQSDETIDPEFVFSYISSFSGVKFDSIERAVQKVIKKQNVKKAQTEFLGAKTKLLKEIKQKKPGLHRSLQDLRLKLKNYVSVNNDFERSYSKKSPLFLDETEELRKIENEMEFKSSSETPDILSKGSYKTQPVELAQGEKFLEPTKSSVFCEVPSYHKEDFY